MGYRLWKGRQTLVRYFQILFLRIQQNTTRVQSTEEKNVFWGHPSQQHREIKKLSNWGSKRELKCDILHLQESKLKNSLLLLQKFSGFCRDSNKENSASLHWYICPLGWAFFHKRWMSYTSKIRNEPKIIRILWALWKLATLVGTTF